LAQDLLRHAVPDGSIDAIVGRALTSLLEDLARKKWAACKKPAAPRTQDSGADEGRTGRHIPAAVKRTVWLRDGGRCAFVGSGMRRCNERGFLEFHHVHPYAVGGEATVDNIEIRCRAHNAYEADLFYGQEGGTRSGTS
jgi:5-methylcytosine-specific restriction endonuclease McrA